MIISTYERGGFSSLGSWVLANLPGTPEGQSIAWGDSLEAVKLADAGDWVKIMTGQLDGTAAFMQGKLKIKGDMGLAIKMPSLFKRPT